MSVCKIRWAELRDIAGLSVLAKRYSVPYAYWGDTREAFRKVIKSKKMLLVAELDGKLIGFTESSMKTPGVCNNRQLFVDGPYRRHGIGGALVIANLKLVNEKEFQGVDNYYYSHKWYGEVPHYNTEARAMYKALKFPLEGVLRKHTKGKSDLWIFGFYPDEIEIPKYGSHLTTHEPWSIDDSSLVEGYLSRRGIFGKRLKRHSLIKVLK